MEIIWTRYKIAHIGTFKFIKKDRFYLVYFCLVMVLWKWHLWQSQRTAMNIRNITFAIYFLRTYKKVTE